MKKTFFVLLLAMFTTSSFASVIKGLDKDNKCTLYRIENTSSVKLASGEVIINKKDAYGISFTNMEINFDTREVLVQPIINIMLGINVPLIPNKAIIPENHNDFNFLINQLNRKLYVFEKVCIDDNGKVVYAKMFETSNQ